MAATYDSAATTSFDSTTTTSLSAALNGKRFFCSWSGGKDSCLSLYRAVQAGGIPAALLTMMTEGGERSRSHGLGTEIIRAQAGALGIPLVTRSASWGTYEGVFREAVREFAERGITTGVFGDIDLEEHREWCVRVCREAGVRVCREAGARVCREAGMKAGIGAGPVAQGGDQRGDQGGVADVQGDAQAGVRAVHPLWKMERIDVVREFLNAGFQAYIVAMKDGLGGDGAYGKGTADELPTLLGTPFDLHAVDSMVRHGIDACGESGEFHTVVTGGPLFRRPIHLRFGEPVLRDGYWFVDATLE
ncbi:MAG: adenosine nucleotide hydrolase [Bacillota bacterium]